MATVRTRNSLHGIHWDASLHSMTEQVEMREHAEELDIHGIPHPSGMPEEATTANLVRRLAVAAGQRPGHHRVLLHSRPLEGGRRDKHGRFVRLPSGADLQLAIRTPAGLWINLLLQAKRLYPPTERGQQPRYQSWKKTQNRHLINWAAQHNHTPGMLLYNDLREPFVAQPNPRASQDWACTAFGGCSFANRVQLKQFAALAPNSEFDSTPAGVSLCIDAGLMLCDSPTVRDITAAHFPLEYLAHETDPPLPLPHSGNGVTTPHVVNPAAPDPAEIEGIVIPTQKTASRWTARLLTPGRVAAERIANDDEDFQVPISVVLDAGPD